jgi:DHA2 family multidrug resistance protein
MGQGLSSADAGRAATAELYRTLGQQAQMLSYIDVFHVLMWVVFAVLPLVLLLQKPKAGAPGAGAAA